ncbi:MAG: ribonuclease HI family protein [Dehalococcoidales bacterium]|nr:ribonuclease HI family protein [Dehalococcoidales bacterium]
MKLIINTDGLSKGNPGTAAIGATIKDEKGKILSKISRCIGVTTNNVAEYQALIDSLKEALKLGGRQVEVRSDSELMVQQLNGRYKIKAVVLRPLYLEAGKLLSQFESVKIKHIPREQNTEADRLANQAVR